jgi:uncharacterized membrane protein YqjE
VTSSFLRKKVKLSLLEYEDKHITLPLFTSSLALMTGFTFIFPMIAVVSLPFSVLIVYSIFTGDIDLIDSHSNFDSAKNDFTEEE